MTPVNCDEAEKAVLDMAYGEADRARVPELQAHYASCASCAEALAKVTRGISIGHQLKREAAPSMAAVLLASRERAAAIRLAKTADAEPSVAPVRETKTEAPFEGFFAWLGCIAMGPQLGVATVLLVVVGIGLWYLPRLQSPTALEVATLEPDPVASGESQGLMPAVPLQLTHDPRTGRVVANADMAEEGPALPASPTPASERIARVSREPADTEADETLLAMAEIPAQEESGAVQMEAMPEMPTAAGTLVATPMTTSPVPSAPAAPMPAMRPSQPSEEVARDVPAADDLGATTLHAEARALAQSNRCAESVTAYQRLLQQHPQYRDGSRASLEMGECLRTLGRAREAREAVTRATRSPVASVASGARRVLVEMDAEARAAEAISEPATTE